MFPDEDGRRPMLMFITQVRDGQVRVFTDRTEEEVMEREREREDNTEENRPPPLSLTTPSLYHPSLPLSL